MRTIKFAQFKDVLHHTSSYTWRKAPSYFRPHLKYQAPAFVFAFVSNFYVCDKPLSLSFKISLSVTLSGLAFKFRISTWLQEFVPKNIQILVHFVVSGFRRGVNEICFVWELTQRRMIASYRRFGTTYPSLRKGSISPRRSPQRSLDLNFFQFFRVLFFSSVNTSEFRHEM